MSEPLLPGAVRDLLDAPNYAHLSTLQRDGSPRNHVVWVRREGDRIVVCTSDSTPKAMDMRRDGRVALSLVDLRDPYRMAAIQGRVVEVRPDHDCETMDQVALKYTSKPFPSRGPDRVCFVIEPERAAFHHLDWLTHNPS